MLFKIQNYVILSFNGFTLFYAFKQFKYNDEFNQFKSNDEFKILGCVVPGIKLKTSHLQQCKYTEKNLQFKF